jgi:hypothetical protein
MKIISKFKDYYDFVGNVYGNDPIVTYPRGEISLTCKLPKKFCKPMYSCYDADGIASADGDTKYGIEWLVVGLKAFMIIVTNTTGIPITREILSFEKHTHLIDLRIKRYRSFWKYREISTAFIKENHGTPDNNLLKFTKAVGHPVYVVRGSHNWNAVPTVDALCPKLGELGLASQYPAEQIYQDIEYFLLNTMNPNPDNAPPIQVADKDRIVQHGFDLKSSFRHRN